MIRALKKLWRNKIFYAFLCVCLIYTPFTLYKTSDKNDQAIITAIALDKIDDGGVELSMLVFSSTGGGQQSKVVLVSQKGSSMSDAIQKANFKLGKRVALAHCEAVVVDNELASDNLRMYLDYFIKQGSVTGNAYVFQADNAKELLQTALSTQYLNDIGIKDLIKSNEENIFSKRCNIDDYMMDYYSEVPIAYVPYLQLEEASGDSGQNGEEGVSSSNSTSGDASGSGTSSSETSKKEVNYQGDVAINKSGKFVRMMTEDEKMAMRLLAPNVKNMSLEVNNIEVEDVGNVDKFFIRVRNKGVNAKYHFVENRPTIDYKINLYVATEEMDMQKYNINSYSELTNFVRGKLKDAFVNKVADYVDNLKTSAVNSNLDFFNAGKYFNRLCNKKWKQYMSTHDQSNYLNDLDINVSINIVEII